jgi:pyrroloquinoline quinone biosynthesis protein D
MSALNAGPDCHGRPSLKKMFRLQWEIAQDAYVLLYPEGMVKLNPSAGEILARCDGTRELDDIIGELEDLFSASNLAADIYRFIDHARQRGWLD